MRPRVSHMDTLTELHRKLLEFEAKHDTLYHQQKWHQLDRLNDRMNALVRKATNIARKHNIPFDENRLPWYGSGGRSFAMRNAEWF